MCREFSFSECLSNIDLHANNTEEGGAVDKPYFLNISFGPRQCQYILAVQVKKDARDSRALCLRPSSLSLESEDVHALVRPWRQFAEDQLVRHHRHLLRLFVESDGRQRSFGSVR